MPSHEGAGAPLRRSLRLRKRPKLSHGVEESDPFSRLTDDIIVSHILSRLSLQEAVRTSVLSRRWLNLWPSCLGPKLIFLFSGGYMLNLYDRCEKFVCRFTPLLIRGVNNVLKAYSKPTLDELTVCFDLDSRSSQIIDSWVEYAFRKGVTRLELDFMWSSPPPSYERYTFPGMDKLSALHVLCNNDLHHPVNCTGMYNLRDVCLKYVCVSAEVVEFILSHCPFLERLSVWRSKCIEKNLKVSSQSSNFKSLEIVDCYYLNVEISSPYLVSLQFSGDENGLYLEHVPLLSEFSIGSDYCRYFLKNLRSHFGYISQLKKLTLNLDREVVSKIYKYPLQLSELEKLEQLEVKLEARKDACLLWLIILIKAAPLLRSFSVNIRTKWTEKEDPTKLQQDEYHIKLRDLRNAIKQVHHQFLKLIEIKGFCGKTPELEFCQHLLGISGSLEQFVVQPFHTNIIGIGRRNNQQCVEKYRKRAQQVLNWLPPAAKLVIL